MQWPSLRGVTSADRRARTEILRHKEPTTEVVLLDEDGVIVWFNDAWARFCGENGGRLSRVGAGISYLDVCGRAEGDPAADQVAAAIRSALQGDLPAPVTMSVPCHSPDSWRWYDTLVSARHDDDGRCVGATVTISLSRSVSVPSHGRRRGAADPPQVPAAWPPPVPAAGEAGGPPGVGRPGRRDDDFAAAVVDLAPIGILLVDDRDVVVRVGVHGEAMFGYGPGGLTGVPVRELLPELAKRVVGRTGAGSRMRSAIRTVADRDVRRGVRRDGSSFPVKVSVGPLALTGRAGTILLVHDRSDVAPGRNGAEDDRVPSVAGELEAVTDRLAACGRTIAGGVRRHPGDQEFADLMGDALGDLDRAVKAIRMAAVRCLISEDLAGPGSDPPS